MAQRKGTQREIATQGLSSPDGLGIGTQGFIEPILGDLILGGTATVIFSRINVITGGEANAKYVYNYGLTDGGLITGGDGLITYRPRYIGSGGLTLSGTAGIEFSVTPVVGGNVSIGGAADFTFIYNITPTGGLFTDGAGRIEVTYDIVGDGGFATDGAGDIVYAPGAIIGEGGIVIGGSATVNSNVGPREFGRGGATSTRRTPRLPNTTFEFPVFNPDDYLQPMDYLKKIQDVLDKAERDRLEMFKYLGRGTIQISGRGRVTVVYRDQPDGKMVVANNPPLEPIALDLGSLFLNNNDRREIAEIEDQLFLNDMLGRGDYKITTGPKARYVHKKKKTTGGSASVNFVSGAGQVKHVNAKIRRRQMEDDELLLNPEGRRLKSRQQREEEELRLLGIID